MLIYLERRESAHRRKINHVGLAVLAAVGSGAFTAMQAPTNAALAAHTGSIEASLISFIVGGLILLAPALIAGRKEHFSLRGVPAWEMLCGVYGCLYAWVAVVASPVLGVALLMASNMLGQLAGGAVIDWRGWFHSHKSHLGHRRLAGIICVAIGVLFVAL